MSAPHPGYLLALAFALVLLAGSEVSPVIGMAIGAIVVVVALLALIVSVFWAAERADGRA